MKCVGQIVFGSLLISFLSFACASAKTKRDTGGGHHAVHGAGGQSYSTDTSGGSGYASTQTGGGGTQAGHGTSGASYSTNSGGGAGYSSSQAGGGGGGYSGDSGYSSSGGSDYGYDSYDDYGNQGSSSKGGIDFMSIFGAIFGLKGKILEGIGQLIVSKGHAIASIGQKLKELDTKGSEGGYPGPSGGYPGPSSGGKGKGKGGGGGGSYGAPRPSSQYGVPSQGKGKAGKKPTSSYGAPSKPSGSYGTPKKPSGSYGTPKKPSGSYGTPSKSKSKSKGPSTSYGQPPSSYGAPHSSPSGSYGAPQSTLSGSYGAPPSNPSGSYGVPQSSSGSNYGSTGGGGYNSGSQVPQPSYDTGGSSANSYNTASKINTGSAYDSQSLYNSGGSSVVGSGSYASQTVPAIQSDTAVYTPVQDVASYSSGTNTGPAYPPLSSNSISYASDLKQPQLALIPAPAIGAVANPVYQQAAVAPPPAQNSIIDYGSNQNTYSGVAQQALPISSYGSNTASNVVSNPGYSDQASSYSEVLVQYAKQQKQVIPLTTLQTSNTTQRGKAIRYSPLIGYGLQEWHPLESNLSSLFNPLSSAKAVVANAYPSGIKATPKAEVLTSALKDNSTFVRKSRDFSSQTIPNQIPSVSKLNTTFPIEIGRENIERKLNRSKILPVGESHVPKKVPRDANTTLSITSSKQPIFPPFS